MKTAIRVLSCLLFLTSTSALAAPRRSMQHLKHIVLDPGHGGFNLGTPGVHGVHEKNLTLPIALAVERLLQAHTNAHVTLTRRDDTAMGLRERTRLANSVHGDLFLSIHCNASPQESARGVEVYFLSSDSATNEIAEVVAREESESMADEHGRNGGIPTASTMLPPGPNDPSPPLTLAQIIQDAQMYRAHEQAELVAGVLLDELHRTLNAPRRGVMQAPFGVLKEAEMPAVVVEVGFLTHAHEGRKLTQARYQRRVARGIFNAIMRLDRELLTH